MCEHRHGDFVNTYWLCGECYTKMAERPFRVFMERTNAKCETERQNVEHAEILMSEEKTTLSTFITLMVEYLIQVTHGDMSLAEAVDYAVDLLRCLGEPFGTGDMDWGPEGAHEIVDEDVQNWEQDASEQNH